MDFWNPQNATLWENTCMLLNPSLIKKVLVTSLIYREVRILKLSKSEMKVNEAKLELPSKTSFRTPYSLCAYGGS